MEGLIFRGAYIWRGIRVSKSIWVALWVGRKSTDFAGQSPCTNPWGAYIWRGNLTEGFSRHEFRGLIFGGAYTWRGVFSEFYGIPFTQAFTKYKQFFSILPED